jgi:hypothetical protein
MTVGIRTSQQWSIIVIVVAVITSCIANSSLISKSKVYHDRLSVGQSMLVSGPWPIFLLLFLIICNRELRVCWCGVPSLTRGRVSSMQKLLGLASTVFLGPKTRETHEHIFTVLNLRLSQPEGSGSCIYNPPPAKEQASPIIRPGIGFLISLVG